MAYFENHDSPRATQVWHERFQELLRCDEQARDYWQGLICPIQPGNRALLMALLKNLQAALTDCSAGSAAGCNLTRGLELGSEWGEETRTDFENETLLHFDQAEREPHASLARPTGIFSRCKRSGRNFAPERFTSTARVRGRRSGRPHSVLRALY